MNQPKPLKTLHHSRSFQGFVLNDFKLLRKKSEKNRFKVLDAVAHHACKEADWGCYLHQGSVAKNIGTSRATVNRALKWLEEEGYIESPLKSFCEGNGGARRDVNFYRLTDKVLAAVGFVREQAMKPLIRLQELVNSMALFTVKGSKLSRSF